MTQTWEKVLKADMFYFREAGSVVDRSKRGLKNHRFTVDAMKRKEDLFNHVRDFAFCDLSVSIFQQPSTSTVNF